jgi:uncharacterized protein (TIGR02145 family)
MKNIVLCIALAVAVSACSKKEPTPPQNQEAHEKSSKNLTVTITSVWVPSAIVAFPRGNISNQGGGNSIVDRGFCYSENPGPTLLDDTVHAGSGAGDFSSGITGLTPGSTYYVKAYGIKNNGDIFYSDDFSFTTLTLGMPGPGVGLVYDQDGNEYHTITLGTQVWMVENLRTTHYRNGDPIPNLTDNTSWADTPDGAYCDYNNDPANSAIYGRLYNKFAALDSRHIAPSGWHVPSENEWFTLLSYAGGIYIAGGRLKEAGFDHWVSPNTGGDNGTGFTALGAGVRGPLGVYSGLQHRTNYWASNPWYFFLILHYDSQDYSFASGSCDYCFRYGVSVRCIMD